jgi:hypothetical protein
LALVPLSFVSPVLRLRDRPNPLGAKFIRVLMIFFGKQAVACTDRYDYKV